METIYITLPDYIPQTLVKELVETNIKQNSKFECTVHFDKKSGDENFFSISSKYGAECFYLIGMQVSIMINVWNERIKTKKYNTVNEIEDKHKAMYSPVLERFEKNDTLNFNFEYIEIDKHYFGFDEDGKITYDSSKMMNRHLGFKERIKPYEVEFCKRKDIERFISDGNIIYLFKNKYCKDGLWHHFSIGSCVEYNYRIVYLKK
jgi:hypothetical protein